MVQSARGADMRHARNLRETLVRATRILDSRRGEPISDGVITFDEVSMAGETVRRTQRLDKHREVPQAVSSGVLDGVPCMVATSLSSMMTRICCVRQVARGARPPGYLTNSW